MIIFLAVRGANNFFNKRGLASATDDLLAEIPTGTDEQMVALSAKLGIAVTCDSITVPPEIFKRSSPDHLAHTMVSLLYLVYDDIEKLAFQGHYTAMHYLAEALLENWPDKMIKDFIVALGREKEYMGRALDAALNRRDLERQVEKLALEIKALREKEKLIMQSPDSSVALARRFGDYDDLMAGRSAMVKFFKNKGTTMAARMIFWRQKNLNIR